MRQIAREVIQEEVPKICADLYNDAIKNLVSALQYDITSVFEISASDFSTLIREKKFSRLISDEVCRRIQMQIDNKDLNIKI